MDCTSIVFLGRHFLICVLLVNALLLWLQRRVNTKPRICLMTFSLLSAIACSYALYKTYTTASGAIAYPILSMSSLNSGFLELLLLYLYPIAIINANRITAKNLLLLFTPWLLIILVQLVVPINFRNLSSCAEMLENIGEINVLFRLLILFVCIVPYTLILLSIPYNWRESCIDKKTIYKYVVGVLIIGLLYCISVLTGSAAIKAIHIFYCIFFFFYITYQELFVRLSPATASAVTQIVVPIETVVVQDEEPIYKAEPIITNPLLDKLCVMMDEMELWRDPDITLDDLAKRIFTNRTTLSALIQQCGYFSYTEFINCKRIEAFVANIKTNSSVNIQQLFYDVGFRSKSTALRNFRLYMGCTPSEYIQKNLLLK